MKEITMISPFFTPSKVKLPSISVMMPLVVPFTITDAPATGPKSSSTIPEHFPLCWEMFMLCLEGIVSAPTIVGSAQALLGKENAPANKIKLIGLILLNIICVLLN